MKKREYVRYIMAFESLILYLNDVLYQAEKLFKKHRVSYFPVVDKDKIVGILSIKDLVKICFVDRHDPYDFTIDTSIYSMFTLEQIIVCNPDLISEASNAVGNQCIVVAIDAKRKINDSNGISWEIYTHGGRNPTGINALEWAQSMELRGAGELLVTSMDKDGTKQGFDLELMKAINAVSYTHLTLPTTPYV